MQCSFSVLVSIFVCIQACWWGHPVTTGNPHIDYYFGLDTEGTYVGGEEPSGVSHGLLYTHYTEQLVRMEFMSTAAFVPVCICVYVYMKCAYVYVYRWIRNFII